MPYDFIEERLASEERCYIISRVPYWTVAAKPSLLAATILTCTWKYRV
jgi:hypothetical protein